MSRYLCWATFSILFLSSAGMAGASSASWPQWRGPDSTGSTKHGSYPVRWNEQEGIIWSYGLPGKGFSTPVVWDEHIIVTAPIDGNDGVLDLDFAGRVRWRTALTREKSGKHRNASGCNPSPVTDGESIFVYYKSGTFASLDFNGKVRWETNLQEIFGEDKLWWDVGTSPVLTEDFAIGTVLHGGKSGLVAYRKATGEIAWQLTRPYDCPNENWDSYATPLVVGHEGQQVILVWGADHVTAYRALDGELLWSCRGFNPGGKANWPSVASPVVAGDVLIITYGRGQFLTGIRLGGSGDVTESHRLWTRQELGAFVPTPAVYDGKLYLLGDRGQITCIDPASGETLWTAALPKNKNNYYSSPTVAGDKLYAAREDGVVFVARIAGEFEILSENSMGEKIIASPVPISDSLLLRSEENLFLISDR